MAKGENITTKFKVDISDLKKGITEANNQIKLANSEFKKASAGMDNWAKSSAGISAKLNQLKSILEAQNSKLQTYQKQLQAAQKYEKEASDSVTRLKQALEKAKKEYGENSDEVKALSKQLSDAEKAEISMKNQVANLTVTMNNQEATVTKTKKEMSNLENSLTEVEKAEKTAAKTGKTVDEVLNDMDDSARKSSDGFTIMKGALASLVADGIRKAIDAAKEFASTMISTAAEVKAETAQFEQTFGSMGNEAEAAIKRVADSTGILETRLKGTGAQIFAFARSNGATIPEAMSLMESALMASADSAAYYDKSLEESSETMMSFLKGNYANDAALGVSATEFTRNAKATELFGKKYNDLTEIQKQQTLLKMVTDSQKMSGAMGQAARESDGFENVMGNLNEAWRQFQAQVGTPVLEALIPVIQQVTASFQEWQQSVDWEAFGQKIKDIADKIISGFGWIIDNKDTLISGITGIIAAFAVAKIATFVTTMLQVVQGIKAAAAAQGIWNAVMAANPIGLIATAIGLLVAGIVLLIQNWDTVKAAGVACWEAIKNAWSVASEWFNSSVIEPVKNFFSELGTSITQFFTDAWNGIVSTWTSVSEWFNTTVIEPIKNFFNALGTAISEFFTTAWETIQNVWITVAQWFNDNVVEPIKNFFQPLVEWFTNLFQSIWDFIKSVFEVIGQLAKGCVEIIKAVWGVVSEWFNTKVIKPIQQFFTSMWNAIKTAAQTAWNFIKSVWTVVSTWFKTNIIQPVKTAFTNLWNTIKTTASNAWNGIKNTWSVVKSWFTNTVITPVKNVFTGLWDKLKTGASGAWTGIKNVFSNVTSWFKNQFTNAWTAVKNVFSTGGKIFTGITEGITSTFKTVVNKIIGGINKVVAMPFNKINSLLSTIRNTSFLGIQPFSGIGSISVPQIPQLATGIAKAKKGHQYLLEGKGDEAVIPLHKNAQWIKSMAGSMLEQMKNNNAGLVGTGINGLTNNSNVNNFTQNIYAPQQPSRAELYRQSKNLLNLIGGNQNVHS